MVQKLTASTSEWLIRPAVYRDKAALQKLVWKFTFTEALELDARIITYRLALIMALFLALFFLKDWSFTIYTSLLKLILAITLIYQIVIAINIFSALFLAANSNWERYWVVEANNQLVACALFNCYSSSSELAYLYVRPEWRGRRIASSLIKHLVNQAHSPVYLACQPKLRNFYQKMGFVEIPWQHLSLPVQRQFHLFRPHPKLWGFPIVIMRCLVNEYLLTNR